MTPRFATIQVLVRNPATTLDVSNPGKSRKKLATSTGEPDFWNNSRMAYVTNLKSGEFLGIPLK